MKRARCITPGLALLVTVALVLGALVPAAAQARPEGEMRYAMSVTLSPTWLDPGEGFQGNLVETDRKKREALLHQIQRTLAERVRFAMIYDDVWPSGGGPRVGDPALLLIDPYPWSAPYEDVKLKKP